MTATPPPIPGDPDRRRTTGSVILLVLVTVLLAGFLLTKFVQRAGTELLADARAADQGRLRREAYSALEVTLAVLADIQANDNGLHSAAQGWDTPFDYADYTPEEGKTVEVKLEDESGKISLPTVDATALTASLEQLGLSPPEAERTRDALLTWMKPGYVPASGDAGTGGYERAAIPHNPALRPLRSFGELAAVEHAKDLFFDEYGRPTDLAREFAQNFSLYSFGQKNLNAATPVAQAADGLVTGQIDALKDYTRQQEKAGAPAYFRAISDVTAVLGPNAPLQGFGTNVQAMRITVTVRDGAAIFQLSAVVAPPGGATLAPDPPPNPSSAAGSTPAAAPPTPAAGSSQETAVPVIKKLDYPFKVLEIREDVESTATPPADSAAHD